ncbi:MAG: nitroreductase family protein [Bacteroides sp.]|nr:nitroreductase family protein [Bacteroides sp.]MCM1086351.1 nitroreductase family protein [Bacteroides sp.]
MEYSISIRQDNCIRCRRCEQACPAGIFTYEEGCMQVQKEQYCIKCGHCADICPKNAIVHTLFPESSLHGYSLSDLPSPEQVELLMKVRRSNRSFTAKDIPQEMLDRIIDAAYAAPTAQNLRNIQIVAVTDPEKLQAIAALTVDTFVHAANLLENPLVKCVLKRKMTSVYAMIPKFRAMHRKLHEGKGDPILHQAKAALFFCAPEKSRFGYADCNLAYQNASLMAESLGVAQFYTGFVLSASKQDKKERLYRLLNLTNVKIFAGMALGMPAFRFERYTDRTHTEAIRL